MSFGPGPGFRPHGGKPPAAENPYEIDYNPYEGEENPGEDSAVASHDPREELHDRLPQVQAEDLERQGAPDSLAGSASSSGKQRRISTIGPSPTPHKGKQAADSAGDGSREQLQEPVHTTASDVAAPGEARWPGSVPPTVDPYGPKPKKSRRPAVVAAAVVAAVLVMAVAGGGAYLYFNPLPVEVSANGVAVKVDPRSTAAELEAKAIEAGMEAPAAGNHLAIDGSVISEGGGEPYTMLVNGAPAGDGSLDLVAGAEITFKNGADTTESFTEQDVAIDPDVEKTGVGAIHAYVPGTPGKMHRKTGAESGVNIDEVLEEPVSAQLKCYNADTGGDKVIALTFDDGPWASPDTTRQILDILEENHVKATFFTVGNCIGNAPDQVKRAYDAGHQICTHSWDHAKGDGNGVDLTRMNAEDQIAEIQKGYDAIKEVTGAEASTVIRAPGGNFDGDILKTLMPYVSYEIGWNIDTMDWSRPGAEHVENALLKAGAGDIVLMHDGGGDRSQTVEALQEGLPKLIEQGYRFVTIDELLAYNNPADM